MRALFTLFCAFGFVSLSWRVALFFLCITKAVNLTQAQSPGTEPRISPTASGAYPHSQTYTRNMLAWANVPITRAPVETAETAFMIADQSKLTCTDCLSEGVCRIFWMKLYGQDLRGLQSDKLNKHCICPSMVCQGRDVERNVVHHSIGAWQDCGRERGKLLLLCRCGEVQSKRVHPSA